MKILMVLTSHAQLGNTGKKTGFWLEEFASPYYIFKDANADITIASPNGGQPPLDPKSDEPEFQTAATQRFKSDVDAQTALFYPGGHGPLWDLAKDAISIAVIESMYATGKIVAAVCHAPAVFQNTKAPNGAPLVKGKSVTGFSNSEEDAVGLSEIVPFLVEDDLKAKGANYSKADDWQPHVITSSESVAKRVLEIIKQSVAS